MKETGWKGLAGWWWVHLVWPLRQLWNQAYRRLTEGKLESAIVPEFESYTAITRRLKQQAYAADGIKQLGDSTHSAAWLHTHWGTFTDGCDCDDFAEYGSALVRASKKKVGDAMAVGVLTVIWTNGSGHAVTIIQTLDGFRWMDYGMPSRVHTHLKDAIDEVTRWYSGGDWVSWVLEWRG